MLAARDRFLAPGGIVLPDRAALVLAGIEDAQYKHEKIEFWSDVYGFDMSCIKGLAMSEPLVDTVDADSVVTKSCIVRHLSIESMSKEGHLHQPFIQATKNDYVHALVAYFDETSQPQAHGLLRNPRFKPTLEAGVFYLEDVITICAGETITGTLSCKPNDSNPRDLDITYSFEGERCRHIGPSTTGCGERGPPRNASRLGESAARAHTVHTQYAGPSNTHTHRQAWDMSDTVPSA